MKQIPLGLAPGPAPSYDNYAAGDNEVALAALREAGPTTIYLWGDAGAGKTHLLRARARAAQAAGERVGAFGASLPAPWPWDEAWRLLLLDGCERFDAAQQQAAFTLFVEAATAGVPVVAAGRLPPVDLPLRDDLRTRLGGGLVFQLQPLGDDAVRAVLAREAERRGIQLSPEVIGYLLTRFARDLGSLMALLDALDEFALSEQRAVTVPLLKRMLVEQEQGAVP